MFFWVEHIFGYLPRPLKDTSSGLIIYLVIIFTYIFCCFWLQRIFRKLGAKPDWLAWIPVANLWGIYKAGNESPWWTLPLVIASLFSLENWISRSVLWPLSLLTGHQLINWTGVLPQDLIPKGDTSFNLLQYVYKLDYPISTIVSLVLISCAFSFFVLAAAWINILKRLGRSPWLVILIFLPIPYTSWWLLYSLSRDSSTE
jgi:hypothetical protein